MQNGNYDRIVDQITDLVLARLGDDNCPTFCRADVERIVDAGAERIGIVLGETATAHDWASLIGAFLVTFIVRGLAIKYGWSLPVFRGSETRERWKRERKGPASDA